MNTGQARAIAAAITELTLDLETLSNAGAGVPAVERNVIRLQGTVRALEVQFDELARLECDFDQAP